MAQATSIPNEVLENLKIAALNLEPALSGGIYRDIIDAGAFGQALLGIAGRLSDDIMALGRDSAP
jgi:hypothetical protein